MLDITQVGRVDSWSSRRGYGFITNSRTDTNIFVHYSGIVGDGTRNLYPGQEVKYLVAEDEKGKYAYNVQPMTSWYQ